MKRIIAIIFFISIIFSAKAQQPSTTSKNVDVFIDELLLEEETITDLIASLVHFQFLYFSVNYNAATYFSGRDVDIDQFNLTPQISYMHSKGFYASLSGIYYSEFTPNWDVTKATVGFGKSFGKNKNYSYYTSASVFFYSNDLDNLYNSTLNTGIGIHTKKRTLGTQISGSFYFGSDTSYQIISSSYANIYLIKTNKHKLKLRPQLSIITGTQLVDLTAGSIQNTTLTNEFVEVAETPILQLSSYSLINSQLSIPLQYSVQSFDFEVGYNFNFPNEIGLETDLENTSFFNFGMAYLLNI
ncbi:hypothetical protein ACFQ5N_09515 [Lutibacter holmesii]|uniref:Uncharacterized protein n=1 Tax=Lutibacter holmesii TaxID=1137985 RepID=A0ABW3WNV2_9FLAO